MREDIRKMIDTVKSFKQFINEQVSEPNINYNFWKWFGSSKVVDKNGNPLIVYHGTPDRDFTEFDPTKPKLHRKNEDIGGIYFTTNQMVAGNYRNDGRIIPVYLKIENPLDITQLISKYRKKGMTFMESKQKALEFLDKNVHDGVIFMGNSSTDPEYIVFQSNQIKSVKNNGDWSFGNNIYS